MPHDANLHFQTTQVREVEHCREVAGEGALEGVCRALRLRLELACLLSWGIVATGTTC